MVSVSSEGSGGYSASFASDLPFGSYYVKERTTNGAYILSDQEYPVVFEYAGRKPPWYRSLSMKARLFPMNFSVGV